MNYTTSEPMPYNPVVVSQFANGLLLQVFFQWKFWSTASISRPPFSEATLLQIVPVIQHSVAEFPTRYPLYLCQIRITAMQQPAHPASYVFPSSPKSKFWTAETA